MKILTALWGALKSLWPKIRGPVEAVLEAQVGQWFDRAIADPVAVAAKFPGTSRAALVEWWA